MALAHANMTMYSKYFNYYLQHATTTKTVFMQCLLKMGKWCPKRVEVWVLIKWNLLWSVSSWWVLLNYTMMQVNKTESLSWNRVKSFRVSDLNFNWGYLNGADVQRYRVILQRLIHMSDFTGALKYTEPKKGNIETVECQSNGNYLPKVKISRKTLWWFFFYLRTFNTSYCLLH
jgi:hypothetical protein